MVTAPARTILPGAGVNPVAGIGEERQALAMRARWKRMPVGNFSNNQDQFVKLEIARVAHYSTIVGKIETVSVTRSDATAKSKCDSSAGHEVSASSASGCLPGGAP